MKAKDWFSEWFYDTWSPGERNMQDTIKVRRRMIAYMILDEVEFLHDGHAEQHKEQAAEVQQQARLPRDRMPPISAVK